MTDPLRPRGRLVLVPNALDHGNDPVALEQVLPHGVMARAAALQHWVVEDARSARAYLKRVSAIHPLAAPLQALSLVELPRPRKGTREPAPAADTLQHLLQPAEEGHDVGLLSEAGLPAVADPGARLVEAAHAAGIGVEVLAGPSSLVLALAASGLNGQSFAFVGYLPQDADARRQRLRELEARSRQEQQSQLFIETPYRNAALLAALTAQLAADTRLSVSCGLTLPGAWTHSARVADWRRQAPAVPADVPAVFAILAR